MFIFYDTARHEDVVPTGIIDIIHFYHKLALLILTSHPFLHVPCYQVETVAVWNSSLTHQHDQCRVTHVILLLVQITGCPLIIANTVILLISFISLRSYSKEVLIKTDQVYNEVNLKFSSARCGHFV